MAKRNHTGITFTLMGILLPILGTVCLASARQSNLYLSDSINESEHLILMQEEQVPSTRILHKKGVHFTQRVKNNQAVYRDDLTIYTSSLNHTLLFGSFSAPFNILPKPAYYTYLFMLKPF